MAKLSVSMELCPVQSNLISWWKGYVNFQRFMNWMSSFHCGIWPLKFSQHFSLCLVKISIQGPSWKSNEETTKNIYVSSKYVRNQPAQHIRMCFSTVSKVSVSVRPTLPLPGTMTSPPPVWSCFTLQDESASTSREKPFGNTIMWFSKFLPRFDTCEKFQR